VRYHSGMIDIAENLAAVTARIERAAARAGRDSADVRLVAVSKKKSAVEIERAFRAGCRDFGENYVQELAEKARVLSPTDPDAGLSDLRWHFVGHLQRNKVPALVAIPGLALVHGVDGERLLRALDQRARAPLDVLIEVNVAGEASKSGCHPDEIPAIMAVARTLKHVRARGLMALPPAHDDPERSRPHFRHLRALRDETGAGPELSMGMSHDFEVAIEEGATWVRVGTAIFGARES
jgi:PLP dependent protein